MSKNNGTILIGVTGGIAAYKAVGCASKLTKENYSVTVAMSPGALEFVRPLSFAAVTGRSVITSIFPDTATATSTTIYPHIYPASETDIFLLVPASADIIAKIANGIADDAVCASALALPAGCRKIFCPAMHVNMWSNASVQRNVATLHEDGWEQIGPNDGRLACGAEGPGRMAEPEEILAKIMQ